MNICIAALAVLLFSHALHAQTTTAVVSQTTTGIQMPEEHDMYEGLSSVKLSTVTLVALHRIHLDTEDRTVVDKLAKTASDKNRNLVTDGNPSPHEFGEARESAEDVCREFSKVLTGKLRGIEKGTTGWELLSSLATGVSVGSAVIGSARIAALVAGGSTAWTKTYGKPDTEHGVDGLRLARAAISEIRLEFGRQAEAVYDKWQQETTSKNKTKLKKMYSATIASFINACKG
ncbi:MAG: hypothetical protein H7Z77_10820 [Chitinophagaceae bacterium]|nr:hypothetical protein [Polaromonas sp.]